MVAHRYSEAEGFIRRHNRDGRTTNLKIGIDTGRALVQIAESRPREVFLGVEIKADKAKIAASRVQQKGLDNVYVLNAEAQHFLSHANLNETLDCIHVYFPTPSQKSLKIPKKPREIRLMNLRFLQDIFNVLSLGGELRFMTDVEDYFNYLENGINSDRWWFSDWEEYPCGQPAGFFVGTPCEQQFRLEGRTIFAAVLQKIRREY